MAKARMRVVVGDIGGTNARFAFVVDGELGPIESIVVAAHNGFVPALKAYLDLHPDEAPVSGAVIAAAGPVAADRCVLTNSGWVIDAAQLRSVFGWRHVRIINDFEATAWSLPQLATDDLFAIGGGTLRSDAPAVVLGPGTGFGLACFLPQPHGPIVLGTEAGHATMPASSAREDGIIAHIRDRLGHVSIERVLSGEGLRNLYEACAALDQTTVPPRSAAEIVKTALSDSCATSRAAVDLFCAMLGTVCGDAVLSFGAKGGLYIAGGMVPRITEYLARSQFRARFEAKGRFRDYVAAVRSSVIVHPDPAFLGLQRLAGHAFDPA